MKKIIFTAIAVLAATVSYAQVPGEDTFVHYDYSANRGRGEIRIPDIDGFLTLKGDFHIHTVFSDGNVWPSARVDEAYNDGLDIIAITDHIEVQPNRHFFSKKVNYNTSYEIAKSSASGRDIIVIHGTEITRDKPFGHMNALFIKDADKAVGGEPVEALEEMLKQGAYIIWNHPGWPDDKCTFYPLHEKLIAEEKIHGVEVWNEMESYPIAYDWVEKYGLHPFANSDVHGIIAYDYAGIRPLTLVFAKEKTEESVKDAMFAGRTLALFNDYLVGGEDLVSQLVDKCLSFEVAEDRTGTTVYRIKNVSDIEFRLQSGETMHQMPVPARGEVMFELADGETVAFENCFIGKNKCYSVSQSDL